MKKRNNKQISNDNTKSEGEGKELQWPIELLTQKILYYINKQFIEKPSNGYEPVATNLNTAIAYELSILLAKTCVTHLPHTYILYLWY
jgi:hypothetical protein